MIQKHTVDDDSICDVDDKSLFIVVQLNQYQTHTQTQTQTQTQCSYQRQLRHGQQQQQRPRLARIWLFLLGALVVSTHQRLLLPNAYPAVNVSATSTMVRMGNVDSKSGWFDPRFSAQQQRGRGRRHRWNVAPEEPSQHHIHPILSYRSAISNSNVRVVQLASSKTAVAKKKTTTRTTTTTTSKNNDFLLKNHHFTDLTFFGKVVAGSVEVVTSVVFDYCMGYVSGYVVGTVLGIPRSIFGSFSSSAAQQRNLWERMQHLHSQSHSQYGRRWGNVSSVFGGCRTTVRILRSSSRNSSTIRNSHTEQHQPPPSSSPPPEDDEWNEILSSILAGALLSRSGT
jgi:hypothetical protein